MQQKKAKNSILLQRKSKFCDFRARKIPVMSTLKKCCFWIFSVFEIAKWKLALANFHFSQILQFQKLKKSKNSPKIKQADPHSKNLVSENRFTFQRPFLEVTSNHSCIQTQIRICLLFTDYSALKMRKKV